MNNSTTTLTIQANICCQIEQFQLEITNYIGHFLDSDYFEVIIHNSDTLGLLRLGNIDGGLQRELQLREQLGEHKMLSPLLATVTESSVTISFNTPSPSIIEEDSDSEYLEEEYYEEINPEDESTEKLILLSELPPAETTLATWLQQPHPLEECLLITSQICQFFRYVYQQKWCFISLFPQLTQIKTPLEFFDLTCAYPEGNQLDLGLMGDYYPPEIAYGNQQVNEQMSSYVVGAFFYQSLHQELPPPEENFRIKKIPKIYQILKISLSSLAEERFTLSQLVNLLVTSRRENINLPISWEIAYTSTLGLSTSRLQNEDSYGIVQANGSYLSPLIVAVVADGMGGMAQGELASKLAVKTIIESPIPHDLTTQEKRKHWLLNLVEKANQSVSEQVKEGGTTLSMVVAMGKELNIAHVGDSRIFLLRNNCICQLSEDHSMVAMLLASGQITYQESLEHPERGILIKSLGSKPRLSDGYVQDLSLSLVDGDIVIICSDGVWDLVPPEQLTDIFIEHNEINHNLQLAVDEIITQVLAKDAHDNATIIALKFKV